MTLWLIIAWILLALNAAALVFWSVVWMRVARFARERPTVRDGERSKALDERAPSLSVIVPAHNEEQVIGACCESLRAQEYPGEIEFIFVLDRCTDRTVEIVRRHAMDDDRIVLIENESCPGDWAGKCNAARLGAERASGEYLIFTDADTQFDPALCRAAVALSIERDVALLSLLSTLAFDRWFEKIAQPVATMQLLRIYPPVRQRSNRPARPFANGQFMLFSRTWYEKVGGHAAVKDDLLEDLAFARLVKDHDGRVSALLADGMLRCAMYESLDEFRNGWKRIYIEACRRKPDRLRKHARRILTMGVAMPIVQVASLGVVMVFSTEELLGFSLAMAGTVVAGWIVQFSALGRAFALGGAPVWAIAGYPVGCWIVAKSMLDGARDLVQRRPVRWGGREYVLEPRR